VEGRKEGGREGRNEGGRGREGGREGRKEGRKKEGRKEGRKELDEIFAHLGYYPALVTDVSGQPVGLIFTGLLTVSIFGMYSRNRNMGQSGCP
jgi:hypothetical protein